MVPLWRQAPKKTAAEIDEMKRAAADPLSLSAEIEEMNRAGEAGATIAYELGLQIRKAFDSGAFGASVQGGVSDRTAQIIAAALTAGLQHRPPPPHFLKVRLYDRVSLKPDTHLCVLCRQRPPWIPVTRRDEEEPYEERTVAV